MKPIREVCTSVSSCEYRDLTDSFGYEQLLSVSDSDYQGDTRVLFRDGEKFGILTYGWGSCSGCDSLQGLDEEDFDGLERLRDGLHNSIQWGSSESTLAALQEMLKDEFGFHAEELSEFVEKATAIVKAAR